MAARLLAPKIGVSLYTWTSIIGVVLAGISVGSYVGGVLADRFPNPTTLGIILLSAGAACLSVLPLAGPVADAFEPVPIIARIVFLTATLFFLPSAILGMVTPWWSSSPCEIWGVPEMWWERSMRSLPRAPFLAFSSPGLSWSS
ncbi:MAG: fused MFS/spermidine synthase [Chloroflexi bacterium]|nr:fused MFS/spermidine synthase [Chloroflexota bacterium]